MTQKATKTMLTMTMLIKDLHLLRLPETLFGNCAKLAKNVDKMIDNKNKLNKWRNRKALRVGNYLKSNNKNDKNNLNICYANSITLCFL
jgi:hypothetical protein